MFLVCACVDCSQIKRKSVTQACDDKSETADIKVKDDEGHEDKRSRIEETTASESEPVATPTFQIAAPPPRCNQCRQLLDDPDLRLFPGDHCDAVCLDLVLL